MSLKICNFQGRKKDSGKDGAGWLLVLDLELFTNAYLPLIYTIYNE
jgi:hypothetical protein